MALWEKSMRLTGPLLEQMKALYGPRLPIEVRHHLSNWIEAQSWAEIEADNPEHNIEATRVFEGMLRALQDLMTAYSANFIIRTRLEALYTHMRNEYIQQPLELVRVVQNCLCREADLVEQQEQLSAPSQLAQQLPSANVQIQQLIQGVISRTEAMEAMFRQLSPKLENFVLQCQESFQIDAALHQGNRIQMDQVGRFRERKQMLDNVLAKDAEEMRSTCTDMVQRFLDCLEQIGLVHNLVVSQELANWKQSQRMFNWDDDRGKAELNNIQQWFEALAELLWRNRLLSKQFDLLKTRIPQHILQADAFAEVAQRITLQLVELIQASFVLEKQPPQVIKTANRFSAVVRLLVGGKLQIYLGAPKVTVTIINDKQAKVVAADPTKQIPANFASGDIMNNQKTMEYNSQTGMLSCVFNFMQLKRIKRNSDKKASEMVTEEKFTLLFRTHFTIGGGELEVNIKTESLPVVVIVHVAQQPSAEATIFWDNAFAEADREPLLVPENVPWPRFSEAINCFFHANCGRGLTAQNLDYLGRMLLGIGPEEDLNQMSVSWPQLCKDQLRSRNFTFWEWFYKHLDLIKSTLKREWMEGSIQGFVQKSDVEKLLLQCSSGTFLIRFSEGEPGGISVAWVTDDMITGDRQVLSLAPWNKHDFSIRPFADRLHDLGHLVILYPNKQKDDVFGKYYASPSAGTNEYGYIPTNLKVTPHGVAGAYFGSSPPCPAPFTVSMTAATPLSPPQCPDMELGCLAQEMEDGLRMVPGRAVTGPEHSRGEEVEGEGRLEQTEGGVKGMEGAEGQEQEGGSEEDTKPGAGVKEEGGVVKWEGVAEKEPLKIKQEQEQDLVSMLEESIAKREEQLLQCEATIQMFKERHMKQLQQMESVMAENEQLRKQIRPIEERALVLSGESIAAGYLRGVDIIGETSFTVTNEAQTFHWAGYGLKLHIPPASLPAGVGQSSIDIKASLAGQFSFPSNTTLIQHCGKHCGALSFVRTKYSQRDLPYQFKPLSSRGVFSPHHCYGSVTLSSFSGLGVAQEGSEEQLYCARLYYLGTRIDWRIHFVIIKDLEVSIKVVRQAYREIAAIDGPDQDIEFEEDKITLEISDSELEGWTILALTPPTIIKKKVDSYESGRRIPSCQLQVAWTKDQPPVVIRQKVTLLGAKQPFNFITIQSDPLPQVSEGSTPQQAGAHSEGTGGSRTRQEHTSEVEGIPKRLKLSRGAEDLALKYPAGMESEPELSDLMDQIAAHIPDKWRDIGIALGLTTNDLECFSAASMGDSSRCFSSVFTIWKSRMTREPYSWGTVVQTLRAPAVRELRLAEQLEKRLIKSN